MYSFSNKSCGVAVVYTFDPSDYANLKSIGSQLQISHGISSCPMYNQSFIDGKCLVFIRNKIILILHTLRVLINQIINY